MVTVVAVDNSPPEDVAAADPLGLNTSFTGTTRLKLSDAPKKAIDNKAINDYFTDPDLTTMARDMLTFTVEFSSGDDPTPADVAGLQKVTVAEDDKIAVADQVATVRVMPNMWDGDPLGGEDKFTVTVTPKKSGVAQRILIIATDLAGEQDFRSFQVAVNTPPKPEGAQETPLKLSSFKEAEGLKSTQPDGTTASIRSTCLLLHLTAAISPTQT